MAAVSLPISVNLIFIGFEGDGEQGGAFLLLLYVLFLFRPELNTKAYLTNCTTSLVCVCFSLSLLFCVL